MVNQKYKVYRYETVRNVLEKMNNIDSHAVFVVDTDDILLGIFTDGDMRRFILKNGDLSEKIEIAMNKHPIVFSSISDAKKAAKEQYRVVYPIVSEEGILIDAFFQKNLNNSTIKNESLKNVPLVIMAGGKGTRLYPYTKILPKALIPIGDLTISERIIQQFQQYGCKEIYFILNYKANMIKAYFNDLEKDYHIHYIDENEFLGTGGGLRLLRGMIKTPFFLSNCDILIDDDLECVYRTHIKNNNQITFVCARKNIVIPYGVIDTDDSGNILKMSEKPEFSFLTNTGVYVINPDVIENIKEKEFIHLPEIAERLMKNNKNIGVFPINEKAWLDMGQIKEMEEMMKAFEEKK